MKIVLHGATNGANFGDYLFAKIFYEELTRAGHNVFFYNFPKIGISTFFKENLNYTKHLGVGELLRANALVYISGGYFGERSATKKETIIRYLRYIPIGSFFKLFKKHIFIIGVGGAPISSKILRNKFVKLINYSDLTIFRDNRTTEYYLKHGANNDIQTSTDTAIFLSKIINVNNNTGIELSNKKHIFLHISGDKKTDEQIIKIVIPAINEFLNYNENWDIIIGNDNICKNSHIQIIYDKINTTKKYIYNYNDPLQLYNLLGNMNIVLTPKLHVGIVSASLKKSVISFPYHPEKTTRFYKQIGYPERCTPIGKLTTEKLLHDIKEYDNKPIVISRKITRQSEENITRLLRKIEELEDEK